MKRFIFFDMGNTLINFKSMSSNILQESINDTIRYIKKTYKIDIAYENFKNYYDTWQVEVKKKESEGKEVDIEDLLIPYIASFGVHLNPEDCKDIYKKLYRRVANCASLEEGVQELLKELKAKQYKVGIISNMPIYSEISKAFFEKLDIDQFIDYYLFSYDIKRCKPNKEIFFKALKDNNLNPADAIMIGDSLEKDYLPALEIGMTPILYRRESDDNEEIRRDTKRTVFKNNKYLKEYLDNISSFKSVGNNNGAILMNSNPFTYGHQYLVDYARNYVDHLFVFVVQEDKSDFSFEDRFEMVKNGCSEYANVTVLPSGSIMGSSMIFPEYFNKSQLNNISIDITLDLDVFGSYIAPLLNIKKRFLGKETNDYVTMKYNESLKANLPSYGIDVVEIERFKDFFEKPISAKNVRKALAEGNYDLAFSMVPITTENIVKERMLKNGYKSK